ncbi:MAG: DUF6588 family protein [Bacteroidales bacterium]|jgi:hypothetical protein|nr:DUF6588 family protein [Bacteroidales bacterium]
MKKHRFFAKIMAFSLLLVSSTTFAQFSQIGNFMAGSAEDAEKLFEAYISPYANGMGAGLSAGWYNTAKSHKLGGFDVTVTLNTAIIPSADKTFDPAGLSLGEGSSLISRVDFSDNESPTAAGKKEAGTLVTYYTELPLAGETELASFNLPKGSGFGYTPTPMVQLGVGTVKETDIIVRYSPELSIGSGGKVGLWGVGIKHSLKQWIPALKRLPVFEMSVMGGYTQLTSTTDINFMPSFYQDYSSNVNVLPYDESFYSGQQMLLDINNITANLLVSANLPVICIYGGVGISSSTTNLKLAGNYPFPQIQGDQVVVDYDTAVKDPIDISIKNKDGSVTQPRLNAGFRLKFAVVTLHFDYTYANYSIATAGLGVTLR